MANKRLILLDHNNKNVTVQDVITKEIYKREILFQGTKNAGFVIGKKFYNLNDIKKQGVK